jgi:hypothetical protein
MKDVVEIVRSSIPSKYSSVIQVSALHSSLVITLLWLLSLFNPKAYSHYFYSDVFTLANDRPVVSLFRTSTVFVFSIKFLLSDLLVASMGLTYSFHPFNPFSAQLSARCL